MPLITDDALDELMTYTFPGNVRELENILERALALYDEKIDLEALGLKDKKKKVANKSNEQDVLIEKNTNENVVEVSQSNLKKDIQDIEKQRIVEALEKTRWNKTKAAKLLGFSLRQLRYRLQKLNIE